MRPEDVLTLALAAAAAGINPRPGLDRIRARTGFDDDMAPLTAQGILTDSTRTAAPGAHRDGRPAHNETKETTVTIFADPPTDTARGKHMTAALAIAHLAQQELPEAYSWNISPSVRSNDVEVSAILQDSDAESVEKWAEFFRTDVHSAPFATNPAKTKFWVEAEYQGAHVFIWTTIPAAEKKAEASA